MSLHLLGETVTDLYESAPCGLLSADVSGRVVRVNQTFLDWSGYHRHEVNGRPFAELLDVGSRLYYETRCVPVLHLDGEMREVALLLRRADETTLPILMNSRLESSHDGEPESMRIAIFDARRRQDYERELLTARREAERSEGRVRTLQQASAAFGSTTSEDALVTALVDIAGESMGATATSLMFVDRSVNALRSVTSGSNPLGDLVALRDPRPESDAVRLGKPVTLNSSDEALHRYPTVLPALRELRFEAVSAVPLPSDDDRLGVLVCFYRQRREFSDDEIGLQQALVTQAAQSLERIQLQHQLLDLAMHDTLTGLANREMLQGRLEQVLVASVRHQRPMALIFLDLDGFKAVNDGLGHVVGDAVLVEVADRLRRAVRRSDTIARFGGDEFIVLCEDADAVTATEVAERILRSVSEPLDMLPSGQSLTASVGVAYHTGDWSTEPDADAVVLAADEAMYRSKAEGKNRHTLVTV